jgi:hypothetical protein
MVDVRTNVFAVGTEGVHRQSLCGAMALTDRHKLVDRVPGRVAVDDRGHRYRVQAAKQFVLTLRRSISKPWHRRRRAASDIKTT